MQLKLAEARPFGRGTFIARLIPLFALVLVAACGATQDTQLERKLLAAASSDSTVDLTHIVREKWDRVCIIRPYTTPEQAKQLTGINWRGFARSGIQFKEDFNLVVFLKQFRVERYAEVARRVDFKVPHSVCLPHDSARFRSRASPASGPNHFRLEVAYD